MLSGLLNTTTSEEESATSSDGSSCYCWMSWFVSQPQNEFLLEIDEEYIRDNFNLYGLRPLFKYYDHALEMILDAESPDEEDLLDSDFQEVYNEAAELYGLIHARFAISPRGLSLLYKRFMNSDFGTCPRVNCQGQKCLPLGLHDFMGKSKVKLFCPCCEQVYVPKSKSTANLDGACFGSSLPMMFLQAYPDALPLEEPEPFVARIFGFKVHNRRSVIQVKNNNKANGTRQPRILPEYAANLEDDRFSSSS